MPKVTIEASDAEILCSQNEQLMARVAEFEVENERLLMANVDCVAWEKACKADLDVAQARLAEMESVIKNAMEEETVFDTEWDVAARKSLAGGDKGWLLRQKADAVDSFVKWVNPHWPKSLATGIADDAKNYTYELRQAADEADKAGGGV
jgi:hypothetical protein